MEKVYLYRSFSLTHLSYTLIQFHIILLVNGFQSSFIPYPHYKDAENLVLIIMTKFTRHAKRVRFLNFQLNILPTKFTTTYIF